MVSEKKDWRRLLGQTRRINRKGPGRYDLRTLLRVRGWRDHRDAPEPILRAQGFAAVLDAIPLHLFDDDRICGSMAEFTADTLPGGIGEAEYEDAVEEQARRGRRNFTAGFDHTLADYPVLLEEGIGARLERIAVERACRHEAGERHFLDAVAITLKAFSRFVLRHAHAWAVLFPGDAEGAASLRHLATQPPRSFREAIQLVWLVHIAFVSEGRAANALGRLDQYLFPYYRADCGAGRIDRAEALDLLCHLWCKVEELGEVTNICIGGLRPDGADGTNDLSYLMLKATRLVLSPHTNLSARLHDHSPSAFHRACFETLRTGVGFPALFNDHVTIPALEPIGIPLEVARDHCMVGCIETMLTGRQPAWSDSRFNLASCLLDALEELEETEDFDDLLARFHTHLGEKVRTHAGAIRDEIGRYPAERFPDPFLSGFTHDCIGRARDINDGGAEYPRFHGIAFMGLATVLDSLSAIRTHAFEERRVTLGALKAALAENFATTPRLRARLLRRTSHYGNDDPRIDRLAPRVVDMVCDLCLQHRLADGGRFLPLMAANVQNIPAGAETGATPDGRGAGEPLSDAASPFFGRDRRGPTAFLRSVATPDYRQVAGGSVINMKFDPAHFDGEEGALRFEAITRTFVRERIQELQVNFTSQAELEDAMKHPEQYENLVVRVSGFSAYFTRLAPEVQQDVIRRRSHGAA